jgi:hypothetical protein
MATVHRRQSMAVRTVRILVVAALVGALLAVVPAGATQPAPPTRVGALAGLPEGSAPHVSAPVAAPMAFSLIGFSLPAGAALEVRTSPDGVRWSAWEEMELLGNDAGGPDTGTGEDSVVWREHTEPLWTGAARWLQVRLDGAAPEHVAAHLVDSLGIDRSLLDRAVDRLRAATAGAPAHADPGSAAPAIVHRHEWGADERWRRADPAYGSELRGVIVHHTAGSNTYSPEEAPAVVRAIYAYHTRSLGWNDIGYNLLVDRFGTVYEGRAGGVDRHVIGAHTGGFNSETAGVALMGTHTEVAAPDVALESMVHVLAWKSALHGLDPVAWTTVRSRGSARHPSGSDVQMPVISGHRTLAPTACPGDALYTRMQDLREAARARMDAQEHQEDSLLRRILG